MITAIWFFAITVAAFEIGIVWKVKPLYRLITEWQYGDLAGVIFSVSLSVFVAGIFSAAGTIAMAGAVLGTLITAMVYKLRLIETTLTIVENTKNFIASMREAYTNVKNAIADTKVRIQRTIVQVKRAFFAIVHPVQAVKGMNPHTI